MKNIVNKLIKLNKTIATMESCTGGGVANAITNIEGASNVLKFSAVTYSNEFKIKMGVSSDTIDKYSVYSINVAQEMSRCITKYANSDYGIGVTGRINVLDKFNNVLMDNMIYVSIYDKENDKYYTMSIESLPSSREINKENIINNIVILLNSIL